MRNIPPCRHEVFSTAGLRPGERGALYHDTGRWSFAPVRIANADRQPLAVEFRRLVMAEGQFTDLHMTSTVIGRSPRLCRADGVDDIVLTISLGGGGAGWFGDADQTTQLGTGRVRLRDQARPYLLEWNGADNHTLHLDLPRPAFEPKTRERILAAAGILMPSRGLVPMLAAQMRALAAAAPDLDPAAGAIGLRAALDLATAVLRLEFGAESADSEACADGMFVAAQSLICRRFGSTDLTPAEIARRIGCSRARLYRLFARHGLTVAGYLREVRLERCRAALVAAGPRAMIGDIAFRCGFDNPVHFARLFRQRFGMRPGEARDAEAGSPAAD